MYANILSVQWARSTSWFRWKYMFCILPARLLTATAGAGVREKCVDVGARATVCLSAISTLSLSLW